MKILVTGGAGFIGSAVIRKAINSGIEVVNFDSLTYASCLDNISSVSKSNFYKFEQLDICDRDGLAKAFDKHAPDSVMHLAAESHVDRSIVDPAKFIETNIVGSFNLLDISRSYWEKNGKKESFRFHHISTDEVYGSLGKEGKFTEETPYSPRSPYSASKAASDHLVKAWGETYGLPFVLTNCSNNYGPYQFPEKLIPVVIINALTGNEIPIYGSGKNVRDWLYVEDHADALLTVLRQGVPGRSYNIGGDAEISNIELVRMICKILNEKSPGQNPYSDQIVHVNDRPGHDQRYAIDTSRIQNELGWSATMTLKQGMDRTVEWYLQNREWWSSLHDNDGLGLRLGKTGRKYEKLVCN